MRAAHETESPRPTRQPLRAKDLRRRVNVVRQEPIPPRSACPTSPEPIHMAALFRYVRRRLPADRVCAPFRARILHGKRFEVSCWFARHDVRTADWSIAYWAVVDHRRGWTFTLLSFTGDFASFDRDVGLILVSQ